MDPSNQQNEKDHETLVSYLDGELDHAATVEVENRLASDPSYRQQLQKLERTWDMLDELPTVEPTESFTRSTLELVVNDARKAIRKDHKNQSAMLLRVIVLLAVPVLCYFGTFAFLEWQQQAPARQLIQEIPFLEKYEAYELASSIEFVELLEEQKLFDEFEAGDLAAETYVWNPSADLLEEMNADQRLDLRRARDRFAQLTSAEQKELKSFHEDLMARVNRDQLLSTMYRYQTWASEVAKADPNSQQAINTLADGDPKAQVQQVKRLLKEQRKSMFGGNIVETDKEIIYQWFERIINDNENLIRDSINEFKKPESRYANYLARVTIQSPLDFLARMLIRIDPESVIDLISPSQLEELKLQLSKRSQQIINDKENEREQRRFVVLLNSQTYVSSDKLRDFYYNELTSEERSEFDDLFGSKLREAVRIKYLKSRFESSRRKRRKN